MKKSGFPSEIRSTHDPVFYYCMTNRNLFSFYEAVTPSGFRITPMVGVIAVGCVASVVSVACIVIVVVIVQRKRSRRRRRRDGVSNGESKTAIDGGTGTGTRGDGGDGNVDDGGDGGGGCGGDGDGAATVGNGGTGIGGTGVGGTVSVCNGDHHHHRADAVDDGLERNPDIIPHDNGNETVFFCIRCPTPRKFIIV